MGLEGVVAPLFQVTPIEWQAPGPAEYDALLLTSANAPRHAGSQLAGLSGLPCYCVGEATAAEGRRAGLAPRVGPSDGNAVLAMMADEGVRQVLHLCGQDHSELHHPLLRIDHVPVYAARAVDRLPCEAVEALGSGALALVHSPRAGRVFGSLVDAAGLDRGAIRIAAISRAAADAAGEGWACCEAAAAPRDEALLELAAKLCNIDGMSRTGLAR